MNNDNNDTISNYSIKQEKKHQRVHIVILGYDTDRIIQPIIDDGADKVYIIYNENDDTYKKFLQETRNKIKKSLGDRVEINSSEVDLSNLFKCVLKFKGIIERESQNHVKVNISTGTKISAIAGMFACMSSKIAEPYYIHVEYLPEELKKSRLKKTYPIPIAVPVFPLLKPKKEEIEILKLLEEERKMSKKQLLAAFVDPFLENNNRKIEKNARYAFLTGFLESLEKEWGFINVEKEGRNKMTSINKRGSEAVKLFG